MYDVPFLCLFGILARAAYGIEVVTGSPCYASCGGGGTPSTALVCNDADYTATQYGQTMAACLTCESTSLAVNTSMPNGGTTDEYWFMFNMKYTLQTCVIDSSSKIAAVQACEQDCSPLQPVLDTLWLSTKPYANQYDFCSVDSDSFPTVAPKCANCLQSQKGSVVLGNFVQIMSDACASQPLAQNNKLVSLPRALLDTSTIARTQSPSTASSSGSAGTSTIASGSSSVSSSSSASSSTATPGSVSSTSTSASSTSGLSTGATAGIGIGIGLVALGALAFLAFWILRRRKQRSQHGLFAPELPAYSPGQTATSAREKDAFSPAASELGSSGRHEVDTMYHQTYSPVELDASRRT